MQVGVELLALRIDGLDPVARQRLPQAAEDEQHAVREPVRRVAVRVEPRRLDGPLQVVEHRHDLRRTSSAFPRPTAACTSAPIRFR